MTQSPDTPFVGRLNRRSILSGIATVGTFLAVDLGAVAYANNWIGTRSFTPRAFIERFQSVYGLHPGFRRNHAKGVAVSGYFDSNGGGRQLSSAAVFGAGHWPVVGRFSLGGGNPGVADTPKAPRGLGLAIGFAGRNQWRTAMLNFPVFPVNSPQAFYDQVLASKPDPATGKPDPAALTAFYAKYPASAAAAAVLKRQSPTAGFADSTFSSLNVFYFVSDSGNRTPVRWSFVPRQVAQPAMQDGRNGLFDALVRQLHGTPLQWDLHLTMGTPTDPLDPTIAWPAQRRVINAGTLVLDHIMADRPGNARDISFDPLVLPNGIEPSDDPLLSARSAVYAQSYRARTGESPATAPVQAGTADQ